MDEHPCLDGITEVTATAALLKVAVTYVTMAGTRRCRLLGTSHEMSSSVRTRLLPGALVDQVDRRCVFT